MRWLILVLLAQGLGACCLWDRDTLASEAKGLDSVSDAITGKLDRYPSKFYEKRLERIVADLPKNEFDLPVYDDIASALDRLGRYDEALQWLEKKRLAIERLMAGEGPKDSRFRNDSARSEQQHRRLINEASILLHRWLAQGAQRERMEDVTAAKERIVEARKLNPNVGAERYMLLAAQWLIAGEKTEPERMLPEALGLRLANKTARGPNNTLAEKGFSDCFDGLAGLIRSSEMWECVDVFYWLSLAFAVDGKQSLSYLARLRAFELIDAGKGSLVPGAPTGEALKQLLIPRQLEAGRLMEVKALGQEAREEIEDEFGRRRRFAKRVIEARWEFMLARMEFGAHPDTDPLFWSGFEPPSMLKRELPADKPEPAPQPPAPAANAPAVSQGEQPQDGGDNQGTVIFVMAGAAVVFVGSMFIWFMTRNKDAAA